MPRGTTTKKQYRFSSAVRDLHGGFSILMLRKAETELLAETFRRSGFRHTAAVSGLKNRWDIIYREVLHSDECTMTSPTRGKSMKSLGLPQCVVDIMELNHLSIRKWANAYGLDEDKVMSEMQSMARLKDTADTYISNFIGRDFPVLSKNPTTSITIPPKVYIRGDIVIRQGYGKDRIAIAKMDSGIVIKGAGKSTEEAEYVLKAKARALTRLSSLYHYLYNSFPLLEDLIQPVEEPYFGIPEDNFRIWAENKKRNSSDFASYVQANQ